MHNTHAGAATRPTNPPRVSVPPPNLVGFSAAWGQVLCESLPCPQAHSRRANMMEILTVGAWTGLVWWVSWATCTALQRKRQHLYSRRLIAWERQARREAALSHDVERLR